jgi:hypothetical protein
MGMSANRLGNGEPVERQKTATLDLIGEWGATEEALMPRAIS